MIQFCPELYPTATQRMTLYDTQNRSTGVSLEASIPRSTRMRRAVGRDRSPGTSMRTAELAIRLRTTPGAGNVRAKTRLRILLRGMPVLGPLVRRLYRAFVTPP